MGRGLSRFPVWDVGCGDVGIYWMTGGKGVNRVITWPANHSLPTITHYLTFTKVSEDGSPRKESGGRKSCSALSQTGSPRLEVPDWKGSPRLEVLPTQGRFPVR